MEIGSKKQIIDYYSGLVEKHGVNKKSLGRDRDASSQHTRFGFFADVIKNDPNSSILDVGCGLGHLCDFLRTQGWTGKYTGVDITYKMCECAKKRLPDEVILNVDILDDEFEEKFDYVACIATVQHKPIFDSDPVDYLKEMIKKLYSLTNKVLVFDVFSNRGDFFEEDHLYVEPAELLAYCYSLTKFLSLKNDYKPYQIMMFLHKNNLIADGKCKI